MSEYTEARGAAKFKKIDRNRATEIERRLVVNDVKASIFGSNALDELDEINSYSDLALRRAGASREGLSAGVYQQSREDLYQLAQNASTQPYVEYFLNPIEQNAHRLDKKTLNEAKQYSRVLKAITQEKPFTVADLMDPFALTDGRYHELLTIHKDRMVRLRDAFAATELPVLREDLRQKLKNAIVSGLLPPILEDRIDRALSKRTIIGDALLMKQFGLYGIQNLKNIIISETVPNLTPAVYCHEVLHELSGRTSLVIENERRSKATYVEQRSGVSFDNTFTWLNEGITDDLAREICGTGIGSYPDEVTLYSMLQSAGRHQIPSQLFVDAYFENYDPSLPPDERIPAWKKLYRAVNESFGSGFLTKLDAYISSSSPEAAAKQMKEDWQKIAEMSNNELRGQQTPEGFQPK